MFFRAVAELPPGHDTTTVRNRCPPKENYRETCATRRQYGRSICEYSSNPLPRVKRRRQRR